MNDLSTSPNRISPVESLKIGEEDQNDNSNPQQGSVCIRSKMMKETNTGEKVSVTSDNLHDDLGQRPAMKIPPTIKDSRKLFVGGLPSDITDAEFRDFFTSFGEIIDSVVMFDRETGRSRGFGFVTFVDPAVCQQLLQFGSNSQSDKKRTDKRSGRLEMRGKLIEIKLSEPKQVIGNSKRSVRPQHSATNPPVGAVHEMHYISGGQQQWHNPSWQVMGQAPYQHTSFTMPYQYVYPSCPIPINYYSNTTFDNSHQHPQYEANNAMNQIPIGVSYYMTPPPDASYDFNGVPAFQSLAYLPTATTVSMPTTPIKSTTTIPVTILDADGPYIPSSVTTSTPMTTASDPSQQSLQKHNTID